MQNDYFALNCKLFFFSLIFFCCCFSLVEWPTKHIIPLSKVNVRSYIVAWSLPHISWLLSPTPLASNSATEGKTESIITQATDTFVNATCRCFLLSRQALFSDAKASGRDGLVSVLAQFSTRSALRESTSSEALDRSRLHEIKKISSQRDTTLVHRSASSPTAIKTIVTVHKQQSQLHKQSGSRPVYFYHFLINLNGFGEEEEK